MSHSPETLRMQYLSGIITEGEYKAKLEENEQKGKLLYQMASFIIRKLGFPVTIISHVILDKVNKIFIGS